jgi:hypothetical protein
VDRRGAVGRRRRDAGGGEIAKSYLTARVGALAPVNAKSHMTTSRRDRESIITTMNSDDRRRL